MVSIALTFGEAHGVLQTLRYDSKTINYPIFHVTFAAARVFVLRVRQIDYIDVDNVLVYLRSY